MTAVKCRCCGRTDDFEPTPNPLGWSNPSCLPCTVDGHKHTWIPMKTAEQFEAAALQARRRSHTTSALNLRW